MRRIIIALIVLTLMGCSKQEVIAETEMQKPVIFDDDIRSLVFENIGPDVDSYLNVAEKALRKQGIEPPYNLYDNRYTSESQHLVFDLLTSDNKLLHVDLRNGKNGTHAICLYDTPEEDKRVIRKLLTDMLGEGVDVEIEDTYTDYIRAYAQDGEYRWKDGLLERVD